MSKPQADRKKDYVRYNDRIRVPQVRLIFEGQNLGVVSTSEALSKARANGLDLVEVAANSRPPVCSIMDYGKYMYERQKKEKKDRSNGGTKEKEITMRYVIGDHDLATKANQVRKFLEKGDRVKLIVKFKQREKAHKDQGFVVINKLLELVKDICVVEKAAGFEGNDVTARLDVKKE